MRADLQGTFDFDIYSLPQLSTFVIDSGGVGDVESSIGRGNLAHQNVCLFQPQQLRAGIPRIRACRSVGLPTIRGYLSDAP